MFTLCKHLLLMLYVIVHYRVIWTAQSAPQFTSFPADLCNRTTS